MTTERDFALLISTVLLEYLYRMGVLQYQDVRDGGDLSSLSHSATLNASPDAQTCIREYLNTFYLPASDPEIIRFHTLNGRIPSFTQVPSEPEFVIPALADPHMLVRVAALALLVMADERSTLFLTKALEDKNSLICGGAAHALGKMRKRELLVDALIPLTKHQEGYVRASAVGALGNLGGPEVVSLLIDALKDKFSPTVCLATDALASVGERHAVELLISNLERGDDDIRECSVRALGQLGDPRAIEYLVPIARIFNFKDTRAVKRAAREAIERIRLST